MKRLPRQNILYKNIYHALCSRIFEGEFPGGTRLPSLYELAQSYNVSPVVIREVFLLMQEIGLIHVFRGKEAMVLYNADNLASRRNFDAWLAGRRYTLSEVYRLVAQLSSTSAAFGASLCDASTLVRLDEIAARATQADLPVNRRALALAEYYFVLIQPLHNDRLEDLMRACDSVTSIAVLLAAQDTAVQAEFTDRLCRYLTTLHSHVRSGRHDEITALVATYAYETRAQMLHEIDRLTAGLPTDNTLLFDWAISGNENLYTEIANDLILRISTGEFFDGEFLPSELRLQKEYETSSKTIRNALIALNDCGIVRTINGLGTRVTYLTPAEDATALPIANPQEAYTLFNAMQLIMLNTKNLVYAAFESLTEADIQITRERVERLLTATGNRFYSYVGILMNVAVQNCPYELTRRIFRQFHTWLFLLCHKRQFFDDVFQNHLEKSTPFISGALLALDARNADGYRHNLDAILGLVAKSTLQICELSGLHCEVTLPF